jgi:hypothetical protein
MNEIELYQQTVTDFADGLLEQTNGDIGRATKTLQDMIEMGKNNPQLLEYALKPENMAMAKKFLGVGTATASAATKTKTFIKKIF